MTIPNTLFHNQQVSVAALRLLFTITGMPFGLPPESAFTFTGIPSRQSTTMDNGDKVYYTYEGTWSTDLTKPFSNKWKILSGTGKYKGIKGSGTCSGKVNADGSYDLACTGTYSLGK